MLSDPQGESDADADIEDTDCRSLRKRAHSAQTTSLPLVVL